MTVQQMLLPGEKLLWQGAPVPGIRFEGRDIFLTLFGLFFFGFSIFWEFTAYNTGAPIYFMLFGIPFIAVGAYLFLLRYFWEAFERGRTIYVLTDKRAIIKISVMGRSQKTVTLSNVDELAFEEKSGGTGTIIFGRDISSGSGKNRRTSYAPRFKFIQDAARVYQMAEGARLKGAATT